MALYYLDTSALVKRYIDEVGSQRVRELCSTETVAMSWLALLELASALARRTHQGYLVDSQRDEVLQAFLEDSREEYLVFAVTLGVIQDAADMLLRKPPPLFLRSLDALHLATGKRAFSAAEQSNVAVGVFVSADQRLLDAAQWAALPIENPQEYQG